MPTGQYPRTPTHNLNNRLAQIGKPHRCTYVFTLEHRNKLKKAKIGYVPWNKGLTKETNESVKQGALKVSGPNSHWFGVSRKGPLGPFWKGGRSPSIKLMRESKEYKTWRTGVFKKDKYICQGCGRIGGYLEAHHIKSFTNYPESRYDLANGTTLCLKCHSKTHNYKGRGRIEKQKMQTSPEYSRSNNL